MLTGASCASVAPETRNDHEASQRRSQQRSADIVDLDFRSPAMWPERPVDDRQRQYTEREIDEKNPAPGKIIDDETADERSEHGGKPEDAAEESLIPATLSRRHHIADDGDGRHDQSAAAEPLQNAEGDQLGQILRETAKRRADEKNDDRRLQYDAPSEEIAELAVKRHHDRRRQKICRDDPRKMRKPPDVADDRRQRSRDDRLIERSKQKDERQRREYRDPAACFGLCIVGNFGAWALHVVEALRFRIMRPADCAIFTPFSGTVRHVARAGGFKFGTTVQVFSYDRSRSAPGKPCHVAASGRHCGYFTHHAPHKQHKSP